MRKASPRRRLGLQEKEKIILHLTVVFYFFSAHLGIWLMSTEKWLKFFLPCSLLGEAK